MTRNRSVGVFIAYCLVCLGGNVPRAAQADIPAAVLQTGKRATAIVHHRHEALNLKDPTRPYEVETRGTAFCITRSGYFVTAAHVVGEEDYVRLTVQTGPHQVEGYNAYVEKRDKALDLALLKVSDLGGFVPIDVMTPPAITRGMHVTAFGFPVRGKEFYDHSIFYGVSVGSGRVTAVYGKGGAVTDVQTDTGLGPGASGGPIVNDRGQLVCILQKGRRGTRSNLAKSSNALRKFLADPKLAAGLHETELEFNPPGGMALADMAREYKFTALVKPGLDSLQAAQATLTLSVFGKAPQVYHSALRPDGSCEFRVPIFAPHPNIHTVTLTVSGERGTAPASYQVEDRSLTVEGKTVSLSDIDRIEQGAEPVVVLKGGMLVHESVSGLEDLGKGAAEIGALRSARRIVVHDDKELPRFVTSCVTITRADKTLAEHAGRICLENLPPRRLGQPMLIACGTAWATNSTGTNKSRASELSPSTVRYIRNIMDLFAGGAKVSVLVASNHWTFGAPFQEFLRAEGHTVTVTTDPGPLEAYDVVFVGGSEVDQHALERYVWQGGKLYFSGGQDADGDKFNTLLNHFGLYSQKSVRPTPEGAAYKPLFEGVDALKLNGAMYLTRSTDPKRETLFLTNQSETSLWAIFRGGENLNPASPAAEARKSTSSPATEQKAAVRRIIPRVSNALVARLERDMKDEGIPVDMISPTMIQNENPFGLKGDKSSSGLSVNGQGWTAEDGGWFSYELKIQPGAKNILILDMASDDTEKCGFDVIVDGVKIMGAKPQKKEYPGGERIASGIVPPRAPSYMRHYPLPPTLLNNKDHVVVRVEAQPKKTTGRINRFFIMALQATP